MENENAEVIKVIIAEFIKRDNTRCDFTRHPNANNGRNNNPSGN
jgi:hypothetical protein